MCSIIICWSPTCPSVDTSSPESAGKNVQYLDLADFQRPASDFYFQWIVAVYQRDVQTSLLGAGASLGSSPSLAAVDRAVRSAWSLLPVCPVALLLWCCLLSPWIGSPSHGWPPSCSFAEQCPASISVIKNMSVSSWLIYSRISETQTNILLITTCSPPHRGLEDCNWAFGIPYISSLYVSNPFHQMTLLLPLFKFNNGLETG